MSLIRRLGIPFAAALAAAVIATALAPSRPVVVAGSSTDPSALKPLVDTHEFMEHIVDGAFATVKSGLAEAPANNKAWRGVRDAALLLGESGNLLLIRKPDDAEPAEWAKLSVALRETGNGLEKAAKAKDYDRSRKAYLGVVQSCNQCHAKYGDDGEPKIEP